VSAEGPAPARRFLFVANGHGETAIAARLAAEVRLRASEPLVLDLLPLVGDGAGGAPLRIVGPHRTMPSGGLVAMGNVRAIARDLRAGFALLLARQSAFLLGARARYDLVVAVGDAYALALALIARLPTVFVGTAKSAFVAPYGPFERALLRRARRTFVRDAPTAQRLRKQHVAAEAPGNVIADLVDEEAPACASDGKKRWIGILPGSREDGYTEGVRLARILRALGTLRPEVNGLFSIAPTLEAERFARLLGDDGWDVTPGADGRASAAFEARSGPTALVGWTGSLGSLLAASELVLGQAGTANEQAAAFGVPVVALEGPDPKRDDWYRMRQRRLLGDGLLLVPAEPAPGAAAIAALLDDRTRLQDMRAAGRARMGGRGAARTIARELLEIASALGDAPAGS
jgi:uncharacterized protein (TIGR03492 family)